MPARTCCSPEGPPAPQAIGGQSPGLCQISISLLLRTKPPRSPAPWKHLPQTPDALEVTADSGREQGTGHARPDRCLPPTEAVTLAAQPLQRCQSRRLTGGGRGREAGRARRSSSGAETKGRVVAGRGDSGDSGEFKGMLGIQGRRLAGTGNGHLRGPVVLPPCPRTVKDMQAFAAGQGPVPQSGCQGPSLHGMGGR